MRYYHTKAINIISGYFLLYIRYGMFVPMEHRASFMFNLLSNLFCSFFILLKVEVQKKEQNKFDNKLNIKDAQWGVRAKSDKFGI